MVWAFFGLWETTLAAAAAAVSVPVVIHLLNRRRYQIVTWAAMRFLLAAQKQNTRKLRLEQLLLLLVRCALVALLAFAMASVMPWAEAVWAHFGLKGEPGGPRSTRMHHVFVFDASLSMNVTLDGKSAFDHARDSAIRKVDQSGAGDVYTVLLLRENPTWVISEPSADARRVKRELEALAPGHGNASLPAALNMVAAKVTEAAGRHPSQAVYFFSDFQRATWSSVTGPPKGDEPAKEGKERDVLGEIQARARTAFVDVGQNDVPNLAIADLSLLSPYALAGEETRFGVLIRNFGTQPKANAKVEIFVGKARERGSDSALSLRNVGHEFVGVRPNEPRPVEFLYRFPGPGTYVVQAKLEADPLEVDNVRSLVLTVKERIPVLVVNGKASPNRFEQASEYLRLALNPFPRGAEPRFAPLRPKVVTPAQFQEIPEPELASYDAIFLADVPELGGPEVRKLESHVRRGGGLFVGLGDKAADHFEFYNRALYRNGQGLLPAQMVKKVTATADHHFALQAQESDFEGPPLKEFSDPQDRIGLNSSRFKSYVQLRAVPDMKARVFLTYRAERSVPGEEGVDKDLPNGDPAMIEWNPPMPRLDPVGKPGQGPARMRGKVVLFASSANLDWNSWPGSPSYGAMIQELARFAVSGRLRDQAALVGAPLEEYLPAVGGELDATLALPSAAAQAKPTKVKTQLVDDVNVFRWTDTELSGLYVLSLASGGEIPYAINVPPLTPDLRDSESSLARHDRESLKALFPAFEFQWVRDAGAAAVHGGPAAQVDADVPFERAPVGPDLARVALWGVLALLLVEVVMAWRFGHYSSVEGQAASAVGGAGWALIAFAFGAVVVGAGAFVLWQDAKTGDFLSFLPDRVRATMEGWLGVPPPPPGEMTHWELERLAVFPGLGADNWTLGLIGAFAVALVFLIYLAEAPFVRPGYKLLLAGLRLFLVFTTLAVFMPQLQLRIDRQGWPDLVLLFDTSRSMGEPDHYQNEKLRTTAKTLGERIRKQVSDRLPAKLKAAEADLATRRLQAEKDVAFKSAVHDAEQRVASLRQMTAQLDSPNWRPTRLQIVQSLLLTGERDWLKHFVDGRRMRVHLFALDVNGRAVKIPDGDESAGDVNDNTDPAVLDRARSGLANLDAEGRESRLGTALRQVIDQYRGANLAAVVMFTDGVTTRDETIAQASEYAAQKAVPLLFVGVGDDHEIRDLRLHDLQSEDSVYVNDQIVFEARLTGQGYRDLTVPVVLKEKAKDGKEKELQRTLVKVDPSGKAVKLRLTHAPSQPGRKTFVIEVVAPKAEGAEKQPNVGNLRLERTIDVVETKLIKVLYVEGQPRYEFRYIKFLLEREAIDAKKNKSIELSVVLMDADRDFASTDKFTLARFPTTPAELTAYDVIIVGDVKPSDLGENNLRNIADFVRGTDAKGKPGPRPGGGGLLMIAGPLYAPHAYKNTPLADVLPIEPLADKAPREPLERVDRLRLDLTPVGRQNPIFRFVSDDAANQTILQKLAPMYWWSQGYKLKPLAEVLAVHPSAVAGGGGPGGDARLPLAVHQFVGAGRSLFYGFEETWRWRFRDDEIRFNKFWVQTLRYLARGKSNRTDLRLDRQTPYRVGEPIKVSVRFPESMQFNDKTKTDVKVVVEYRPTSDDAAVPVEPEVQVLPLAKVEGSLATFEEQWKQTREGKYRFRLLSPSVPTPDGEKPAAEAVVELPPGELDRLRMNQQELTSAAEATQGRFYTLANADRLPDELPSGNRISLSSPRPPERLWNHWSLFLWAMALLGCEWLLRKRKHLL